jgi:hypothetical protein
MKSKNKALTRPANSGAGDGNRTRIRSLGSLALHFKYAGMAAFLQYYQRLNWKMDGK